MVQYTYDGWGNCKTTVIDEESEQTAELNPFRYRSYYYDTETHLYNLKTRYYDPETGRFVSQDDVSYLDPEHINGLNLFAYCWVTYSNIFISKFRGLPKGVIVGSKSLSRALRKLGG